jgi:hypothetical protein
VVGRQPAPQVVVSAKSASRIAGHYWMPVHTQGVIVANTGTGFLSTAMTEAQIAILADCILVGLRGLPAGD